MPHPSPVPCGRGSGALAAAASGPGGFARAFTLRFSSAISRSVPALKPCSLARGGEEPGEGGATVPLGSESRRYGCLYPASPGCGEEKKPELEEAAAARCAAGPLRRPRREQGTSGFREVPRGGSVSSPPSRACRRGLGRPVAAPAPGSGLPSPGYSGVGPHRARSVPPHGGWEAGLPQGSCPPPAAYEQG